MDRKRKEIIYKVDYDLNDPIIKQIEWAENSIRKFEQAKNKGEIKKGQLILYKTIIDNKECHYYGLTLDRSTLIDNSLIICPLINALDCIDKRIGINVGKISYLSYKDEYIALITKIRPIRKADIVSINDNFYKTDFLFDESFVNKLIILYKKFLEKIVLKKSKLTIVNQC